MTPKPEEFIKSIAEQGYRLETAIADLVDNAISAGANKIEVLVDTTKRPFTLFVSDNGSGMDEPTLRQAMQLPSSSVDCERKQNDLGRFGLGLKTASFSQTRSFSVISRKKGTETFRARTWDLAFLRLNGWALKVETAETTSLMYDAYNENCKSFLGEFGETFRASTIVMWRGLHKFETHISELDSSDVLKKELSEVTRNHLSLVFHRFLERKTNGIKIRLNNIIIRPFNPFPKDASGVRRLEMKNRKFGQDSIKIEGFILPSACLEDVKLGASSWTPPGKNLLDMEGVYVYRADRIILFGNWLDLTSRSQKMQLARMRIEIGNSVDHLLHLNVSKSQVEMPYDLKVGLSEYVRDLKREAEREYLNRTIRVFQKSDDHREQPFIKTEATNRGAQMSINASFPLISILASGLNKEQSVQFKAIIRMFNKELNSIRRVHEDATFVDISGDDSMTKSELKEIIKILKDQGFSSDFIVSHVIGQLGYKVGSLPSEVAEIMNGES